MPIRPFVLTTLASMLLTSAASVIARAQVSPDSPWEVTDTRNPVDGSTSTVIHARVPVDFYFRCSPVKNKLPFTCQV